jgi:nitric oxide reductase NorD protein
MYDRPIVITDLNAKQSLPLAAGDTIYLPRQIDARGGREGAEAQYRLFALEQAERIARGTPAHAPVWSDALARDLYSLSEAAAVDATLARAMPGTRSTLAAARSAALEQRPTLGRLAPLERAVEMMVRGLLSSDPARPPAEVTGCATAPDSRAWADETAQRIRARYEARKEYRAIKPVAMWGTYIAEQQADAIQDRIELPIRGTRVGARGDGGDADGPVGFANVAKPQASDVQDHHEGAPVGTAAPGEANEPPPPSRTEPGLPYPEWDANTERYRPNAVLVRAGRAAEGDAALREAYAPLVRRVRQRFELLRARRVRLGQQRDGDGLDLSACVRALIDRRVGGSADDRLYVSVRPARRPIAIALLADVSGSTETHVNATQQVIDVEQLALLLASEALDALGDPYALLTFASRGARDVRVTTLKDFLEPSGDVVRRRVAAMRPDGNTRMGAAVRHATALLLRQNAAHRLLLILSDGRPNDQEGYHEAYGIEDTRQAILEARAHDVFPFCLTVDREGAEYLPHIFGVAGHTILRHADQLPLALLQVVRQLLGSA